VQALLGAILIGVSLGLLGSGGSILTVPVLTYGLGHAERVAIAESLMIVGSIAAVGALPYVRLRRVCWRSVLLFGVPGMAGTYAGAWLSAWVSGTVQLAVFGTVMLGAALLMARPRKDAPESPRDHPTALIGLEGFVVGALTGFVGVGGGFLIVPALVLLRGLSMHLAVGTSLLVIAMKSGVGFAKYLDVLGDEGLAVDWRTIGVFIALGVVGSAVGSRLNGRIDPRRLRQVFAAFLLVVGVLIVWREASELLRPDGGAARIEPVASPAALAETTS
jgi:hypothetical protein